MRSIRVWAVVATVWSVAGCSLLLDRAPQCKTDDDCAKFGNHPYCQAGVCVPSGLGPQGCFYGTPAQQSDYINACTTATCEPFDNCKRLGLCDASQALPAVTTPTNSTIPPLVNPTTMPTTLCSAGATNVIWMYGTSDFSPLLAAVQPLLSAATIPYRAVYLNSTSCNGVGSIFDPAKHVIQNPAPSASATYAFYFDDNGQQVNCLLDDGGDTVDVGVSDLFPTTCNTSTVTYQPGSGQSDYTGPVVPFVLSVPAASSQTAISAEAAHMVFGNAGQAPMDSGFMNAAPWTDPTYYFIRNSGAGSTVLTAYVVNVPKTGFWGIDRLSTDNLRDSMLSSTNAEQSIGILSINYADVNRGNLRSLYLQGSGQSCGYLPDGNKNSFDKMNVRDGHYPLWGYVHFLAAVGAGGVPSAAAQALVTRFSVSRLDQHLIDGIIAASEVPQCAMKVQRTGEVGDYAPQSSLQCGCYFDFKTTGKTSCTACTTAADCPSSHSACNYGYCEVQ